MRISYTQIKFSIADIDFSTQPMKWPTKMNSEQVETKACANTEAAQVMLPELVVMQIFQQQQSDDMQQCAQEMQQFKDDLVAQEAWF